MKTKEELEEEKITWKRYLVKCPQCQCEFLPWHSFGITNSDTNWKQGLFCPECGDFFVKDK